MVTGEWYDWNPYDKTATKEGAKNKNSYSQKATRIKDTRIDVVKNINLTKIDDCLTD